MITSEQVAQLAGVSRATVSRALNGSPGVSEKARERVNTAIAALGYEPDVIAQSLVRQRSNVIALSFFFQDSEMSLSLLGETSQYFYLEVLKNIEHDAVLRGYDLLLPSRSRSRTPEEYIRSLQTRRAAGTIILHASEAQIRALTHSVIPTVFIDRIGQGAHATFVKSDNIDGARQATEHLLSLGHTCIALLTGQTSDLAGMERLIGVQQALTHAGIAPDISLIRQAGWEINDGYEETKKLLAERRDFTAIVACSDFVAIGVLRALNEHNVRVPEDVSLIGFDDVEFSKFTNPPLTTMKQERGAMGRGAVQRLIDLIEGREVSPLTLPTRLVIRQSTGPAAS